VRQSAEVVSDAMGRGAPVGSIDGSSGMRISSQNGPACDEKALAGVTAVPCKFVNVPRVGESPVAFECKVSQIIQLQGADGAKANAWLTLGEVVAVHIDKTLIKDGVYQTALAHPIVRAGRRGDYFEIRQDAMFEMVRPD